MKGYKYRTGATSLRQRQFSHAPQAKSPAAAASNLLTSKNAGANSQSVSHNGSIASFQPHQQHQPQYCRSNQGSSQPRWRAGAAGASLHTSHQSGLRNNHSNMAHSQKVLTNLSVQSSTAPVANGKRSSYGGNILLRSLNQRQMKDVRAEEAREDSNKELAKMQVESFLQPADGVAVGMHKHRYNENANNSLSSTQNYLHARIFGRNLGLDQSYQQPLPRSNMASFTHSRHSAVSRSGAVIGTPKAPTQAATIAYSQYKNTGEVPQPLLGINMSYSSAGPAINKNIHNDYADFDSGDDYDQPAIQGHRMSVKSMNRSRQPPYFSNNLLYKRPEHGQHRTATGHQGQGAAANQGQPSQQQQLSLNADKVVNEHQRPPSLTLHKEQTMLMNSTMQSQQASPTTALHKPSNLTMGRKHSEGGAAEGGQGSGGAGGILGENSNDQLLDSGKLAFTNQTMSPKESSTDQDFTMGSPKSPKLNFGNMQSPAPVPEQTGDEQQHRARYPTLSQSQAAIQGSSKRSNIMVQRFSERNDSGTITAGKLGQHLASPQPVLASKLSEEPSQQSSSQQMDKFTLKVSSTAAADKSSEKAGTTVLSMRDSPQPLPPKLLSKHTRNPGAQASKGTQELMKEDHNSIESSQAYGTRIQIPKSSVLTSGGRVIYLDSAVSSQARMQAPSAKSKKTMSIYNQTPREQQSHLKAKYSQLSNHTPNGFAAHSADKNPSQLTSHSKNERLESIDELNNKAAAADASPRTRVKLIYSQQQRNEDLAMTDGQQAAGSPTTPSKIMQSQRCMTPPYDLRVREQSTVYENKAVNLDVGTPGVESSAPNLAEMLRVQVLHDGNALQGNKYATAASMSAAKDHALATAQAIAAAVNEQPRRAIYTAESSKRNKQKIFEQPAGSIKITYNNSTAEGLKVQEKANFANTEGNVNISAILVQAKRDLAGGICLPQNAAQAQSMHNGSSMQLAIQQMANHNYCYDSQSVGQAPTTTAGFANEVDSFSKINFDKPVNKLVNNVAAAIGESVRRLEPRSQQRSSNAMLQGYQTRKVRNAKSSYATRHRGANRPAAIAKSNNTLINRIARITLESHTEITENQILKYNLENLAHEQSHNAIFQLQSPNSQYISYQQQQLPGRPIENYEIPAASLTQYSSGHKRLSTTAVAAGTTIDRSSPPRGSKQMTISATEGSPQLHHPKEIPQVTVSFAQDSLEQHFAAQAEQLIRLQGQSSPASMEDEAAAQSLREAPNTAEDHHQFLLVSRKPIFAQTHPARQQLAAQGLRGSRRLQSSPSPPRQREDATPVQSSIVVQGLSFTSNGQPGQDEANGGGDLTSDRQNESPSLLLNAQSSSKSKAELKALDCVIMSEAGKDPLLSAHQCSTAREINPKDSASVVMNDSSQAAQHHHQQPHAQHGSDSHPATIQLEQMPSQHQARELTPSHKQEGGGSTTKIEAAMAAVEDNDVRTNAPTSAKPAGVNPTPQVRVFSESAMAPVYDDLTSVVDQKTGKRRPLVQVNDLISCSSIDNSKANTQTNMLIPTLKTLSQNQNMLFNISATAQANTNKQQPPAILLTENSSEFNDDVLNMMQPAANLGFEGLLIQSKHHAQEQQSSRFKRKAQQASLPNRNSQATGGGQQEGGAPSSQQAIHVVNVGSTAVGNVPNSVNSLAMYQTKPNRWLQDAIRRGKKLRRQAHQQAQMQSSHAAMFSPTAQQLSQGNGDLCDIPPVTNGASSQNLQRQQLVAVATRKQLEKNPSSSASQNRLRGVGASKHGQAAQGGSRPLIPELQKKVILGQATQTTSRFSIPADKFLLATSGHHVCDDDDQCTSNRTVTDKKETYTLIGIVSDHSLKGANNWANLAQYGAGTPGRSNEGEEDHRLVDARIVGGKTAGGIGGAAQLEFNPDLAQLQHGRGAEVGRNSRGGEEEEILIEMRNMQDYNSHFPEQGSSPRESIDAVGGAGGDMMLARPDGTPMAKNQSQSAFQQVEFKALPAKMHELDAASSQFPGPNKNSQHAPNTVFSSRLPKQQNVLQHNDSGHARSSNPSPQCSHLRQSSKKAAKADLPGSVAQHQASCHSHQSTHKMNFGVTGERCTISSYESYERASRPRHNVSQGNLGEYSQVSPQDPGPRQAEQQPNRRSVHHSLESI